MESWDEDTEITRAMDVILEIEADAQTRLTLQEGLVDLLMALRDLQVLLPGNPLPPITLPHLVLPVYTVHSGVTAAQRLDVPRATETRHGNSRDPVRLPP